MLSVGNLMDLCHDLKKRQMKHLVKAQQAVLCRK